MFLTMAANGNKLIPAVIPVNTSNGCNSNDAAKTFS